VLNAFKSIIDLFLREFLILTHCVQAQDELNILCSELFVLVRCPILLLPRYVFLIFIFFCLFYLCLLLLPCFFLILLIFVKLIYFHIVGDRSIVSFFIEARFVLKLDCKVRTKSGHFVIEHFFFTDDILNEYVLWDTIFFVDNIGVLWLIFIVFEKFISYTIYLIQNFVLNKFELFRCMLELNVLLSSLDEMCSIIIVFS